jgi:hypothetical protein
MYSMPTRPRAAALPVIPFPLDHSWCNIVDPHPPHWEEHFHFEEQMVKAMTIRDNAHSLK